LCAAKGSLSNASMWNDGIAAFADGWTSECCHGLMCRLGSKLGEWRCSNSTVHGAGPSDVVVRGAKKLPSSLPANRTILGLQSFEGSIASFSDGELLVSYCAGTGTGCAGIRLRRSLDFGVTFQAPEEHSDLPQTKLEWSVHVTRNDTVLLSNSNGGLFRSVDRARTFHLVSIPATVPVLPEGHENKCLPKTAAEGVGNHSFGCTGWTIIEVQVALDVKFILTPPCIFDLRFSIQNIQGGVRMALTSTPDRGANGRSAPTSWPLPLWRRLHLPQCNRRAVVVCVQHSAWAHGADWRSVQG
jgi:hypothetical protein